MERARASVWRMSLASHQPVTPKRSDGLKASFVASAAPCILKRATVTNTSAGTLYLHIFDASSLPGVGAVPITTPVAVAAGSSNGDDWRPEGLRLEEGCVVALSSTLDTLTIVGSDVGRFFVEAI